MGCQRKNLITFAELGVKTINGITYTPNANGSVTANGTATNTSFYTISFDFIKDERYILSGCPEGGSKTTYCTAITGQTSNDYDYGNGSTVFSISTSSKIQISLVVFGGVTVNNLVFNPMLRHAEITDGTYEPYKPSVEERLVDLENYDANVKAEIAEVSSQAAINKSTLGYQRKNLLKNTAVSKTINGVTFTVNKDGSVTVNGTANNTASFDICTLNDLEVGKKYTLSGCPNGGNSSNTYRLYGLDTNQWEFAGSDVGNGNTFTAIRNPCVFRIAIYSGYTAENLTFFPMLRYAEITDDTYEPYRPSVAEYIASLEERISALEGRT